jgi:methyl-accepting chemotaxis protein
LRTEGAAIEQVNSAVEQLDEVTQQNAALVEQASAAAHSMNEQASLLRHAVDVFKVSDECPVAP